MMSFRGSVLVLLAAGLEAAGAAGAAALEAGSVDRAVGAVVAPLDAAGSDELQAAAPAMSVRMATAAGTGLSSADLTCLTGAEILIIFVPQSFLDSC